MTLVSIVITIAIEALIGQAPGSQSDDEMARFLLQGNGAHIESFTSFTMKYQITEGSCATVEDALASRWSSTVTPVTSSLLFAHHGERYRQDRVYSEGAGKQSERYEAGLAVRMHTTDFRLWNSVLQIDHKPGQLFWVRPLGKYPHEHPDPLYLGYRESLQRRAELVVARFEGSIVYQGEREYLGKQWPVVAIYQRSEGRDRVWLEYCFIDPARGFIPIRIESYSGTSAEAQPYLKKHEGLPRDLELSMLLVVADLRPLSQNRWIPWLYRILSFPKRQAEGVGTYEVRMESIDVEKPPAEDVFSFEVPKGRHGTYEFGQVRQLVATAGKVGLEHFNPDGSLREGQSEVVFRSDVAGKAVELRKGPPPVPAAQQPESNVPRWPFGGDGGGWSSTVWLGLGLVTAAIVLAIVVLVLRRG